MHLPELISDLALILIVAGITTVIFKKIRQPLVLGYIVAGFLTGPYFNFVPTVVDMENIHVWSEIGIICLMFALGLEFSFHKLANVGGTAIITALTEVCGLFLFGFTAGHLLGWNNMDCIILGGVLSMSSTTIIIKAFEELGLRGKKFTEIVFGALIVEDIAGIFMMVFMSTFALSQGSGGSEMLITVLQLLFYLVLWLILGIYIIPTLLKKAKDFMNDETLLIVSLGICFGVVLLFSHIGFSTALGSFIAGSILAGTVFAEKIEHLNKPIKDLFGAVFFISVGMLVDPAVLLQYAWPIAAVTLTTISGKLIFSSMGVLISGQKLKTAVYCGASLAQIGEFSFIIAALAMSLGLSSDFIYPVVVSVSVITTFTTPFCIKHAENIYSLVKKAMPEKLYEKLESRTDDNQSEIEQDNLWKDYLKDYFIIVLTAAIVSMGIYELGAYFIAPFIEQFLPNVEGRLLTTLIILGCMAPFLVTLLQRKGKNFTALFIKSRTNLLPLIFFGVIRVTITIAFVMLTVNTFMAIPIGWLIIPALIFVLLLSRSDWIAGKSLQIQARFLLNFSEKILFEREKLNENSGHHPDWLSEELWVGVYCLGLEYAEADQPLRDLRWKREFEVNIIKIVSGKKHINIPGGNHKLNIGDIVYLFGSKTQMDTFHYAVTQEIRSSGGIIPIGTELITLREFITNQKTEYEEEQLFCYGIQMNKDLHFEGKNIKESGIRKEWNCDVIGIKRDGYPIIFPDVKFVIHRDDQIWLLGDYKMAKKLIAEGLVQDETRRQQFFGNDVTQKLFDTD